MPCVELLEDRNLLSTVHALFDLSTPASGPFPSNRFTVADPTQNTGLRVNMPLPDPTTAPFDFQDTQVINTLDGFNVQPRLSIPFDGSIDPNSVNSQDVFLVSLGDTLPGGKKGGEVVGINQIVWDPATSTLHVESDQLLDQHTRYALIVTNGVLDATDHPVQASDAFTRFRHDLNFGQSEDPALKEYRKELIEGMATAADQTGVPVSDIVTASVFTTQSVTAVLEKIRDQIDTAPPPAPADFNLGVNGERTVFSLGQVTGIKLSQQTDVGGPPIPQTINTLSLLRAIPGAVGQVAYGMYRSPDFEVHPGEYIPAVGTLTGAPAVQGYNDIYFDLYLPNGTPPAGGWPVAIVSHGGGTDKDGPFGVAVAAGVLAAKGIATIGINDVGSGRGPGSTLTITQADGSSVTLPSGGRGIDQNGDGKIDPSEGLSVSDPSKAIISERDGKIQTVADLMQLVRVIKAGVDVEGNTIADLNPSSVYYVGASLGGMIGALFLAVEPTVRVGVLNNLGGSGVQISELRAGRGTLASETNLVARGLINDQQKIQGIASIDGLEVTDPHFNENMPLRDGVPLKVGLADGTTQIIQSPVTNNLAGAMAIQQVFDNWEWVSQPSNPVAYAAYLRQNPLPGVPAKSVIIQFAKGDRNVGNPTTTAFLRAGNLRDQATYYRHDLAYADNNARLVNPHTFLGLILNQNMKDVALAAQQQIATFFTSNGTDIIQPPGVPKEYFEVPIQGPLPEGLNFVGITQQLASNIAAAPASGESKNVITADLKVPNDIAIVLHCSSTGAVSSPSNAPGISTPNSARVPNSSPMTAADAVFADLARIASDARNADRAGLTSGATLGQQAAALGLRPLDALPKWEAGAIGVTKNALMRDLLVARKFSGNGL